MIDPHVFLKCDWPHRDVQWAPEHCKYPGCQRDKHDVIHQTKEEKSDDRTDN